MNSSAVPPPYDGPPNANRILCRTPWKRAHLETSTEVVEATFLGLLTSLRALIGLYELQDNMPKLFQINAPVGDAGQ